MANFLRRIPPSARWSLVLLIVVVALIVAIWPSSTGGDSDDSSGGVTVGSSTPQRPADPNDVAAARAAAALEPCPTGAAVSEQSAFKGLTVPCLGGGPDVDLGAALTGMPTVLNIWATWCGPCRQELPLFQQYAERAAGRVRVVTMQAPRGAVNTDVALAFLAELHVRLPALDDSGGAVFNRLQLPQVYPITVLVRPDGSVARVLPQTFTSLDGDRGLSTEVQKYLGVAA
jgi:thiol-disulfide isomerase/thioredoxin